MRVGIPTEIKNNEFRVAITPAGVAELVHRGHEVIIQAGAGEGSAISDADFKRAGAQMINSVDEVWAEADLLLKVKEPIEAEYSRMRKGQTLFTYLHLAASKPCTDALMASGTTSIAYETVQTADGALPLLAPMSEVAGRLAAQVGAYHLMRTHGGRGVLMGGVPGVAPANVVVIGGGMAGDNAAAVAKGMGAHVTVFDLNINTLRKIDAEYGGSIETRYSSTPRSRGRGQGGRPGDRRGPGARRQGAQARHQFDCRAHEAGRRAGRHRDRPGRLLRGLAAHHARRPDLRGARHGVLLRRQHARRRAAHVDLRADQRDHAVRGQARRAGAGRPPAQPIPLWPRAFRRTRARCSPSRWPPTSTCPSPIRPPFWPDRSTEHLPVHIKPTTGSNGEAGPLM